MNLGNARNSGWIVMFPNRTLDDVHFSKNIALDEFGVVIGVGEEDCTARLTGSAGVRCLKI